MLIYISNIRLCKHLSEGRGTTTNIEHSSYPFILLENIY